MKRILRRVLIEAFLFAIALNAFATATFPLTQTHTNVTCPGGNNGTINVAPAGGTAPYTYLWNDGDTSQNRANLSAGTYSVTCNDNSGKKGTLVITINQPANFVITKAITSEKCGGDSAGTITINVSGGTPGYTFLWSNGDTSENLIHLKAAVYYVTVTDANACTTIDSANVTQPPGVGIIAAITNATCGAADGSINITVEFGNPSYNYIWNDGSTTQNRAGLTGGNYELTVTDSIGCTATAIETVSSPAPSVTVNYTAKNPSCNGASNGSISITSVTGASGPFSYLWNTGSTTQDISALSAGTYFVQIITGAGCTDSIAVVLSQPPPLNISLTPISTTCFRTNNGAINDVVTGGTPTYAYNWNDGATTQNRLALSPGNYLVTVTDSAGCTISASTSVIEPTQLDITATATGVTCAGGNTGDVTTTVTGGSTPYSYWWGSGVTSANRIGVSAGTYSVTLTDGHGCTAVASANVAAYNPMTISSSQINNTCYGDSAGWAVAIVSYGHPAYSYLWSNGSTTQSIGNLAAGNFTLTVTDNHLCTVTQTITITQPPFPIVINSAIADANCSGDSTGTINITVNNGSSPYHYNWGGGITTQNRTALTAGSYNLTVTDAASCSVSGTFTVNQPLPISVSYSDTSVSCFGGSNGSIQLMASGGIAPLSFDWGGGITTKNRTDLSAGTYSVTTTDNHSCTAVTSVTITQPTPADINMTLTNVSCFGGNNGVIDLTVTGATSPYSYYWNTAATTANINGLTAGTYQVTVTDSAHCTFTSAASLSQPSAIGITSSTINVGCNGGNTGSITLTVTGGTPSYSFDWGGGITTQNITQLIAGNYSVTVTDSLGCTDSAAAVISQPAALNVNAIVNNITCNGSNNGSITLTATGGTPGYSYNWGGGITSTARHNLSPGNYTVTTTDNASCTTANTITLTEPSAITSTVTTTDVKCHGAATGAISLIVNGGVTPYSFSWSNGPTSQNISALTAGSDSVQITDNSGCTASNSATINQPSGMNISATVTNVSCFGKNNGTASVTVSGGVSPYLLSWSTASTSALQNNLSPGSYLLMVTDSNSCQQPDTITITQPSALSLSMASVNDACYEQASGSINPVITGGTQPYYYTWNDSSHAQNLTAVSPEVYTVTITDQNACSTSGTATITQPSQISVAINSVINASCFGGSNGGINVTVSGGTPGYGYLWSNGSTVQNLRGATSSTYTLTVTDANHCTTLSTIGIAQPQRITIDTTVTPVSCYGENNGAIKSIANGGNGDFSYSWSNGSTNENLNGISSGTYYLTVNDIVGCTANFTIVVGQPQQIMVNAVATNVSCNGGANGAINLTVQGGSPPYSFNWGSGITSQNRSALTAGNYTVTVTDVSLCSNTASQNISAPAPLVVSSTQTGATCSGNNGSIQLNTSGGTSPYAYNWGAGITSQNRSNLSGGMYYVTVTDSQQCSLVDTFTIAQMPAMTLTITKTDVSCYSGKNGSANLGLTGGTAPFKYLWSNSATTRNITNLAAGNYNASVIDANACNATVTTTINQPTQMVVDSSVVPVTCYGGSNGAASVNVSGGTPGYNYKWSNNTTSQNVSNLFAGNYTLSVTDSNSCIFVVRNITVAQPEPLILNPEPTSINCSGGAQGGIQLQVSGGTAPYLFNWSDSANTQNINNVNAGTYSVTVTDAKGCKADTIASITATTVMGLTSLIKNTACTQVKNGAIDIAVTGGAPGYIYRWNTGDETQNLANAGPGNYTITVTDKNGCTIDSTFEITADYDLQLQVSGPTAVNYGQTAGLTAIASSDHGNNYSWTPEQFVECAACSSTIAKVPEDLTFTATVVDTNGCKASDQITVTVNKQWNIYIPNVFSPNNDGNNDVFKIYGDLSAVTYTDFVIFDRWGEKVFETNDYNNSWNGTYKGEPAPVGTYIYIINLVFADATNQNFKGSVTLLK